MKFLKSKPLHRRTVLRGAGVSLMLPWLEAMMPVGRQAAAAETGGPAPKLLLWIMTDGAYMPRWQVNGTGAGYSVADTLEPVANLTQDITVVSGTQNRFASGSIGHGPGCGAFLTCVNPAQDELRAGISFDQVIANHLAGQTPVRSLQLGTAPPFPFSPDGYPPELQSWFSWVDDTTILPNEIEPAKVFEKIVGAAPPPGDDGIDEGAVLRSVSVLDAVLEDSKRLQSRLGATDKQRLEQYTTYVREIEQRIQAPRPSCEPGQSPAPGYPTQSNFANIGEHVALMHDMILLAFSCDLTRVITFVYDWSASSEDYSFAGLPSGGYHSDIVHSSRSDDYAAINKYILGFYADLVQRMQDAPDPYGGSLLDSCAAVLCSEYGTASQHQTFDLPCLIAGSAGGRLATGQHLPMEDEPWANVGIALMQMMGVEIESFGLEGTRAAPGLLV